jgi:hypothetical protein
MPSFYQVSIEDTLAVPHGHILLFKLAGYLRDFAKEPISNETEVVLVGARSSHSNDFMYFVNDVADVALPWDEIDEGLDVLGSDTVTSLDTITKRQRKYVNIGSTTSQCCGHNIGCRYGPYGPQDAK